MICWNCEGVVECVSW